ncbi:sugar porter family MFS transporter [Synechocystis sp. FACHB-898]|uniref:sugar porter family MFS transporter n=1 Tax=unclassified Synechocystis TaxID=2640012 RepID=UPI00168A16BD|nr:MULTISPECIES: sugar porter family MFS transporter [unclassified Synechocystis]MBD2619151.1 sugar porter family MFS transporter [Synechocystis sp. FACHB-898]MBD2639537.1 sugar porter family MFS transporter [Synechocystis sp. FACHB-908]MBD2661900.1 sugar porter family MFS transporter [Synechocystis sp. FACHB-929]
MNPSSSPSQSTANVKFVLLISGVAALGGFLFGFDTAVINGAVAALQKHFQTDSLLTGLSVSLALLGSALGAFGAGPIADRHGRIKTMILAAVLFTLSSIGSGLPFTIWDFIFWRVLGGIGVGAASVIAPAYIAEVSPAHLRGRLGSLQQLAIVSGIFIALLSNWFIALMAGGSAQNPWLFGAAAWRWMFWTELIPALLYGVCAFLIPESPRYLVAQGQGEKAAAILWKVEGGDVPSRIEEIQATVSLDHKPRFSDLLSRRGGLLPIVWIGMGLSALQQFVGINVIFYYSSVLWRSVGFTEEKSLLITVITGFINILTTLVAIAFVDKFGRKPLLLMGSIGMTITLGILSVVFGGATVVNGQPTLTGAAGIIALVTANLYVFSFGFSWGPIVWVLLGEMFNNKIRAAALSVAAGVQWIANFIISTTFPPLWDTVGLGPAYGLYATSAAISIFFIWFFVKETKGKTLEQM